MAMNKKNVLGRGLGALIEESGAETSSNKNNLGGSEVNISLIEANPFQPRSNFDKELLDELAESIKEVGVIQPVTVRELPNGRFQLITGERRFRAAQIAGLESIPAFIRHANDQGMLEMALIENIQREDLNAVEIAISYQRLMDECDLTQESLSARVGKKRATVANYLRLLKLPAEIQLGIKEDRISMGHAKAIANIEDSTKQINAFYKIINEDLSVRKAEELARKQNKSNDKEQRQDNPADSLPKLYEELKNQLAGFFNVNINLNRNNKGQGKIVIPFTSDDELERIIGIFDKLKD